MLLAGCGLFQSGSGDSTKPESPTDDQTFKAPIGQDPAKTSVYINPGDSRALKSAFATTVKDNASGQLQRVLREDGLWTDGLWVGADIQTTWLEEPITVSPNEVSFTIRDDARWSDGHQITGKDFAIGPLSHHIRQGRRPYYADDDKDEPANIYGAFDGFEITEQSVTYRSSQGFFDNFWEWTIKTELGNAFTNTSRSLFPTHIDPYDGYADAVIETVRRAQNGELNPWKEVKPWEDSSADSHRKSLMEEYLGDGKYVAKFSKAGNVLATGAWDLVEFRGSEAFVFEKNPHHRNTNAINFDTLMLEYTPSAERQHAALKADRLDYGSAVTPQSVVDSLPDHITQLRIPGSLYSGNELGLNFNHSALGKRTVRMAIMYALDHSAIANNIHQSTTEPVITPGGDCWDATDYVSQEWIDANLITYGTNRDKAASLMREAGYTKNGEQWIGADGNPLTLTLPTGSDSPRWEPTVASQLSEFGIQTTVRTLNQTEFSDRRNNGEFNIWPTVLKSSTNLASATLFTWYYAAIRTQTYGSRGIYPDEQFQSGDFSRTGAPVPRTENRWRAFTIKAPAIGKSKGTLTEYHPSALSLFLFTNPSETEFRNRVKTGVWLANWFLPTIPINKTNTQHFIDDAHWKWPKGTQSWNAFSRGSPRSMEGILASGDIHANPDQK